MLPNYMIFVKSNQKTQTILFFKVPIFQCYRIYRLTFLTTIFVPTRVHVGSPADSA